MNFELDDAGFWTATALLASWDGYSGSSAPNGKPAIHTAHGGSVRLVFAPEDRDANPLTQREQGLVDWAIENERAVSEAVKACIFRDYADVLSLASANDLERLIHLQTVYVHQIEEGDIPYIGFEFGCPWNVEHGLGVLMHGSRCVEVGEADTAMLLWIAERHAAAN